jgi:hypothetical protein
MAQVTITLIDNPEKEHVVDTVFDADPPIDLRPEGERTHDDSWARAAWACQSAR